MLRAPFHEVTGLVFIVMTIIHNVINIKWYKALKKGAYNRKRKMAAAVNFALVADMAAILLAGIINSRFLFCTGNKNLVFVVITHILSKNTIV